jgi:hypothetical protein
LQGERLQVVLQVEAVVLRVALQVVLRVALQAVFQVVLLMEEAHYSER